jgi:hypothetical protein
MIERRGAGSRIKTKIGARRCDASGHGMAYWVI